MTRRALYLAATISACAAVARWDWVDVVIGLILLTAAIRWRTAR